jgi:hypothetical protein
MAAATAGVAGFKANRTGSCLFFNELAGELPVILNRESQ